MAGIKFTEFIGHKNVVSIGSKLGWSIEDKAGATKDLLEILRDMFKEIEDKNILCDIRSTGQFNDDFDELAAIKLTDLVTSTSGKAKYIDFALAQIKEVYNEKYDKDISTSSVYRKNGKRVEG